MTNEILLKNNNDWLYFSEPYLIISTQGLDEVIPAFREIERLIETNGWHAAGFIAYEAAPAFDAAHIVHDSNDHNSAQGGFPLFWFGLYPLPRLSNLPGHAPIKETLSWLPTVDRDTYNSSITQIKNLIANGQNYHVNYTMRLRTIFISDHFNFFLHLAQAQNNQAA